jgi:hypothetical protein
MAEEKGGFFAWLSGAGAFFGRVLLPLGLFSVLAVGLHVGSDRVDDHLFVLISWLDGLADGLAAWVIRGLGGVIGASDLSIDQWTFRAAEWIDVDAKTDGARIGALVVELAADAILALQVFLHRSEAFKPSAVVLFFRQTMRDPTVLKIAGPLAMLAAGLAGTIAVSRELQVFSHAHVARFALDTDLANFIASSIGFVALALVAWRVLVPLLVGAVAYADRRSSSDIALAVRPRTRRMRGWITAIVALPVALIALYTTPVLGTLRALLWM